jgi:hypothetical protein
MQRPNEREFLREVLRDMDALPEGLADRLVEVVDRKAVDRAEAIRKLFEELARE